MKSSSLTISGVSSMFFFNAKKRREYDEAKKKEADNIMAATLKKLDKATVVMTKANKAIDRVDSRDLAVKLYYAMGRRK